MKWMNRPLSQFKRRLLSLIAVIAIASFFFLTLWLSEPAEVILSPLLLLFVYGFAIIWLSKSTANMAVAKDKALDERQRALRDKAYRISYAAFVAFALFMVGLDVSGQGDVRVMFGPNTSSITSLLLSLNLFLLSASPILVIGWLEPDPIEENDAIELNAV